MTRSLRVAIALVVVRVVLFVVGLLLVARGAWAQEPVPVMPYEPAPAQTAEPIAMPPLPPPITLAAPPMPVAIGALDARGDVDGAVLAVPVGLRVRLPRRAATIFDRRWQLTTPGEVLVSATFTATSTSARYGLVVGLPPGAEESLRGTACVVSPAGEVRLVVRTGSPEAEDLAWAQLPPDIAKAIAAGTPHTLTLRLVGNAVRCAVNGTVIAELGADGTTGLGVPGVWTAGTGDVAMAGFRVEVRQAW